MQCGLLGQHQQLITKLEETINEAKVRINGFYGEAFGLSAKSRRKVIQDMIWEVDQNLWKELHDNIGQIFFFDSKGQKAPYAKLQCRNMYQASKLMKAFKTKFSKTSKFVGSVVDERGTTRRAELWMEK
eukprot:5981169-Karenia_brevis.AAC.1